MYFFYKNTDTLETKSYYSYSETLNNEYIERIHQCRILHFLIIECCRYLVFKLNDYMELFKTVPAYSWLFIYYRKY